MEEGKERDGTGITSSDWHVCPCLMKHMTQQPVQFTHCKAAHFIGLSSLEIAVNLTSTYPNHSMHKMYDKKMEHKLHALLTVSLV